jgi:hypothetical protein
MSVHVTAIDVDHVWLLHERFAILKSQLDAVFSRLYLERESTGVVRGSPLTVARIDVYDLDRTAFYGTGAFRPPNGAADGTVRLERLRAEVDNWPAMTGSQTEQQARHGGQPYRVAAVRALEPDCPHIDLAG